MLRAKQMAIHRTAPPLPTPPARDWASEVDKLYRALKDRGVVDVKFAFGALKDRDAQEIYRAVATALDVVIQNEGEAFKGLNDSYGLAK